MTPEEAAEKWTIPDEPLTAEKAALMAASALEMAAEVSHIPDHSAALVAVADGWTRLHTALANAPKTIEPAPQTLALPLPHDERRLPAVTVYNNCYKVTGWDFNERPPGAHLQLKLDKI